MCGQVKHAKIFSSIRPDWRLVKLLAALPSKNTDGLIGGVIKILADEGIQLRDSTLLLKPLLAAAGVLTRRKPDKDETDRYRLRPPRRQRAGRLRRRPERRHLRARLRGARSHGRHRRHAAPRRQPGERPPLTLVKVARRREHLLFDVPVVGLDTIPVMRETGTTVLAVEAGRTLMLDKEEMIDAANAADIAIVGHDA